MTCSTERSASRISIPRCAEYCSTRDSSTGRRSRRPSSGRCSSRLWSRPSAAPKGRDLRAASRRLQARRDSRAVADLRRFRDKLGSLRLFDPACGCGNFLIIACRELRTLEIDVLREIASRPSEVDGVQAAHIRTTLLSLHQHGGRQPAVLSVDYAGSLAGARCDSTVATACWSALYCRPCVWDIQSSWPNPWIAWIQIRVNERKGTTLNYPERSRSAERSVEGSRASSSRQTQPSALPLV